MTKKTYQFVHLTSYLTIAHGVIYWIVQTFMQIESQYGPRPHPAQTYIQGIHIILSPLLIISFGILWNEHIIKFFKAGKRKFISGVSLTISLIILIISGYLIQIIYNPSGKEFSVLLHLVFGLLYTLAYLIHHFKSLIKPQPASGK